MPCRALEDCLEHCLECHHIDDLNPGTEHDRPDFALNNRTSLEITMRRATSGRLPQHSRVGIWAASALLALFFGMPAMAITVDALRYDAAKDQLVMTIVYRGTNPDHKFSVQWDECKRLDDERSQILGLLIDSQPDDLARQDFTIPFKIDLRDFPCRPAKVTIRTSAGFFASVDIPAPPSEGTLDSSSAEARNAP
jgi:hypothetical protein